MRCNMNTAHLGPGNIPSRPNSNPFTSSSQVRNPAGGRRMPPPETPIAVGQFPEDPILTTRQAAALFRVSIDVLKKWRHRPGKGPNFIRYPSGAIHYRLSAIVKLLGECTVIRE